MTDVIPAPNREIKERPFSGVIAADIFTQSPEECPSAQNAHATDMTFMLPRVISQTNAFLDILQLNSKHSQHGENYSRVPTKGLNGLES